MYMTFGNVFLASNTREIPLTKMKLSSQLMLVDEENSIDDTDMQVNKVCNLILAEKLMNNVYVFNGSQFDPRVFTKEDENGNIIIDCIDFDNKINNRGYLLLPGNKTLWINPKSQDIYFTYKNLLEIDDEDYNKHHKLHSYILKYHTDRNYSDVDSFSYDDQTSFFYTIPLGNETTLALIITHTIIPKEYVWRIDENVMLINSKGQRMEIYCNMNELLELIDPESERDYEKFNNIRKLSQYSTSEYIQDKNDIKLNELINLFKYSYHTQQDGGIKRFFEVIYENEKYKTKSYLCYIHNTNKDIKLYFNNEPVYTYTNEFRQNEDLKQEYLVACNITKYITNQCTGINPVDGNYYSKNELVEDQKQHIIYKDNDGIIVKQFNSRLYYIKVHEHYVLASDIANKKEIAELNDRFKLISTLETVV